MKVRFDIIMNKQDMKSSIDYQKINMPLKCYLILLVVLMCFDIFLLIFIIYKIPHKYLFEVILTIILAQSWLYLILIIANVRLNLKRRELILNCEGYNTYEIILPDPIYIETNKVKYLMKIEDKQNNINVKRESNTYNIALITSKNMLIGYNKEIDSIIFIKNL